MIRKNDELNLIKTRTIPPEKYFGEMELEEGQIEKRLEYTKKANEIFDLILVLILTMTENGYSEYDYLYDSLESRLITLIAEYTILDSYLLEYVASFAYNFLDVTRENIDDEWYLSEDRSLLNAENQANDLFNYEEYKEAIRSGKTKKIWIT